MTVTIKKMSAGKGYEYLLRTVSAGDGDRSLSTPLTRYYPEAGTPHGRWMGSGVTSLESHIAQGDEVTEEQIKLLIGEGKHPAKGSTSAVPTEGSSPSRTASNVTPWLVTTSRSRSRSRPACCGPWPTVGRRRSSLTRTTPRSPKRSTSWSAVTATRAGAKGPKGGVAQLDVTGVIATAFDHYDSRANDPHLHTHVVISNRVMTASDGAWRTLDGTPLHAWVVAVSELHEAEFSDRLTRALGVGWERRPRGRDRNPAWEVATVSQSLVEEFSGRSHDINTETDRLIEGYVANHGRRPRPATIMKLRAQATIATRPEKHVHSLADLTMAWRRRTAEHLDIDAVAWASHVTTNPPRRLLRADDVPLDVIEEVGRTVVTAVGEKRSSWRRANLYAEAARQTIGWRFASTADREATTGMVVDAAEHGSLRLTPPDLAATPEAFTRDDGTSTFRPKHSTVFSSEQLLAAEDRLLQRAATTTAPTVNIEIVDHVTELPVKGHRLSPEQAQAIATIAVSGRRVDLLIGPAEAGKTTAMRALHRAWTKQHGKGSVVGLAPSAAAAQVLAEDLGIGL